MPPSKVVHVSNIPAGVQPEAIVSTLSVFGTVSFVRRESPPS